MAIYLLSAGAEMTRARLVEQRIRRAIPELSAIADIKDIADVVARSSSKDPAFVLVIAPSSDMAHFTNIADMAASHMASGLGGRIFFVLISDELSASDYKALLRRGDADWVSVDADPKEIIEIFVRQRRRRNAEHAGEAGSTKPIAVSFVPSAGGVGNTTLALETAVKLKTDKATREHRICIIDLDFQRSHVCDYLDIEPRLKIQEIMDNPDRLDDQLFDIFISRHASGLHVFAAPRASWDVCDLNVAALDALFNLASLRYELILIDLPVTWFGWTDQVVSASDGVIVTGVNTVPGLRQTVEALKAVRRARNSALSRASTSAADLQIAVAMNRCRRRFTGGIRHRRHVETVLGDEQVLYVNEEPMAHESINTGTPIGLNKSNGAFVKDIAALAAFCQALKSARVTRP
jgi:pilus assembly protein CpaE